MIETKKFVRKPLYVDAVRVTVANFEEIAVWCQGEILQNEEGSGSRKQYIKVRVHNPKIPRQTQAFIGDWILYTERGYKVYTNKPFQASFDEAAGIIEKREFPYSDGDTLVLGPECFVAKDGSVMSWKGANYVPEEEKGAPVETLPMDDSPEHAAAVQEIKDREGVVTSPVPEHHNPEIYEGLSTEESSNEYPAETTIGGTPREEINVGIQGGDPSAEAEDAYVRELADAAAEQQERVTEEETERAIQRDTLESAEMTQARETIEADGGEVVQATPEAIAEVTRENEQKHAAISAEGKRVLSLEEQEKMTQDEIRDLITTGEVILVQDLAA